MTSHDPLAINRQDLPEAPQVPVVKLPDAAPPANSRVPPPIQSQPLPAELLQQLAEQAKKGRPQGFHRRRNKRYWLK